MKITSQLARSSLALSVSALAVETGRASIITSGPINLTLNYSEGNGIAKSFDLNGDLAADYQFVYANNNANKPQITTTNFNNGGTNQILQPNAASSNRTLPVLGTGVTIDASLYGGVSLNEAFFYRNWDETYYGDWAGPGGTTAPDPVTGPVTGYIGLKMGGGSDWNYGYAHFTINVPAQSITLLDTAYETTMNTGITTVAAVPEPTSTAAAFALGAAGLAFLRHRRIRATRG